jgi:ubiquinone/menaquinone biosynthesis C-methylase UbiE
MYNIVLYTNASTIESFVNTEFINSDKIYDKFYCDIYDKLFYSQLKVQSEISDLEHHFLNKTLGTTILDIGCGTGHHLNKLSEKYKVTGLDNSNEMLKISKKRNPHIRLVLGNANNKNVFPSKSFNVITCFYFTIYYFKDINKFISNVHYWLKPKGIFCVSLVNKDKFDPLLELGTPFSAFSLQKYSKKRLTKSVIHFNNFVYKGTFIKEDKNNFKFEEIFEFKKKPKIRKQVHTLYMIKILQFIEIMTDHGFKQVGQTDLLSCGFEYQYNFYFKKK